MENEKMGQFISELRKSKQMTQKELAAKLNITDKAVSKWECGKSCPDISLLSAIAEALGVTTGELLNGEKLDTTTDSSFVDVKESIDNALHYADKTAKSRVKSLQSIGSIAFSFLLLTGIVVCAICDMAISGAFTWSLFPISSIIFTWITFFPILRFGKNGIYGAMIALSVLIIPFLYVLDYLIKGSELLLPIGIRISVISIVFVWCVFALFKYLKARKLLAGAISFLMAIVLELIINFTLSRFTFEPFLDIWDLLSSSILLTTAALLFTADFAAQKKCSI